MPLSRRLARFNRRVTNPVARPMASRLPGFGVLIHRGRRTGKTYRTPLNCFRREGTFYVALVYGPGVDWLKNLEAAGGGVMVTGGRSHPVGAPRVVGEEGMSVVPRVVRVMLGLIGVDGLVALPGLSSDRPT